MGTNSFNAIPVAVSEREHYIMDEQENKQVRAKIILGYPNYAITENGKVWSDYKMRTKGDGFLKPAPNSNGYLQVCLAIGGEGQRKYLVHRLVATAFCQNANPDSKVEINHKDLCRSHNHYSNLEWTTHEENIGHSYENRTTEERTEAVKTENLRLSGSQGGPQSQV